MITGAVVKESILSASIAACLFSLLVMCARPGPLPNLCFGWLEPVIGYLGLKQAYCMFGPDPPTENSRIGAEIIFADGAARKWEFPSLGDFQGDDLLRHRKEFYYTWEIYFCDYRYTVPQAMVDAARYAARMNANPGNQPTSVLLYRQSEEIAPPGESLTRGPIPGRPREKLLRYNVRPEDLE